MVFDIALIVVGGLIVLVALFSGVMAIWLMIKYFKYNRIANSVGLTAEETARKILDANGLKDIKVKSTGSILFGNSYSHYFKKVRIRRLVRHKQSITALGMGAQKAALAVLDKENDPDMKKRIRFYPIVLIGPIAFIPLTVVGIVLDYFMFNSNGIATIVLGVIAMLFYIYSLILAFLTLKTEVKAQNRAYVILQESNMATADELEKLKELFKLYNIQYINDIILAMLEILYFALELLSLANGGSGAPSFGGDS